MTFIESETIELKSSVVADLCKEVIAFANTRGGTLYIGVEDNGTVIGVDSADRRTAVPSPHIFSATIPDSAHLRPVRRPSLSETPPARRL